MNSQAENFTLFEKLLVNLVHDGLDFAVFRGIAVSLSGYVRTTDDADILVNDSPANIRKLLKSFEKWSESI